MSDSCSISYVCLATATAQKLGRNGGGITFKVLADAERRQLFLTITGNDGGGYFSREVVTLDAIERCLPSDRTQPFAAKVFARSFQGKSANQPGFCAAVFRSLGLLGPVENKPHLHIVTTDWTAWKSEMLTREGEPYVPPAKPESNMATPKEGSTAMTRDTPDESTPVDDDPRRKGRARPRKVASEVAHENPA